MSRLILRKAQSADVDHITTLFAETVGEINRHDYNSDQIRAWQQGKYPRSKWEKRIHEQYFLVAIENQELVGFASLTNNGFLDTLFVHKNHQRKGIAKKMVEALIDYARSNNFIRIETEGSITAQPFFTKMGFTVIRPQKVEARGVYLDNFLMEKMLS